MLIGMWAKVPGAEPGTGSQCVRAQTICSTWELTWGLPLWSGGATRHCRRSNPWSTGTDTVQEICLIRCNGFSVHKQPTGNEAGFYGSAFIVNHVPGALLVLRLFWWKCFISTASPLVLYPRINVKTNSWRCASDWSAWSCRLNLRVLIMNWSDCWLQNSVNKEQQALFGNLCSRLSFIALGLTLPWDRLCWLRAVEASQIFMVQLFACHYGTMVCKA